MIIWYLDTLGEYKDPGRYIPMMLLLCAWGSLFGFPSKVPVVTIRKVGSATC